ncbi:MAG TPA: hypothetical protein VF595_16120 [Tepidisphaeraceae bacterium]
MTKTVAVDMVRRHRNTTHDQTIRVYWCARCDAFHIGHERHDSKFMHKHWRERKWTRKRGRRRCGKFAPTDSTIPKDRAMSTLEQTISSFDKQSDVVQQALDEAIAAADARMARDAATIADQAAQLARLQQIVDALPKTADGVPVTPGMRVWGEGGQPLIVCRCGVGSPQWQTRPSPDLVTRVIVDGEEMMGSLDWSHLCYSTEALAAAATPAGVDTTDAQPRKDA